MTPIPSAGDAWTDEIEPSGLWDRAPLDVLHALVTAGYVEIRPS